MAFPAGLSRWFGKPSCWPAQQRPRAALGALSKVKEARDLLLAAEKINPMRSTVPSILTGQPLCQGSRMAHRFRDKKKAKLYLEKALSINPTVSTPITSTRILLADQGEYAKAADHLKRARSAPPRAGREDVRQRPPSGGDEFAGNPEPKTWRPACRQ